MYGRYGLSGSAISWFKSFLSERKQCVEINGSLSKEVTIDSGFSQGGILSPLLFILLTSDLHLWLEYGEGEGFADDVTTSYSDTDENKVIKKLEEDAVRTLDFMAANMVSANPKKTEFLMVRPGKKKGSRTIAIGEATVHETQHAKLLGLKISNDLSWKKHIQDMISELNQRLGVLKRLCYVFDKKNLKMLAEGLVLSKIRYGISVYSQAICRWILCQFVFF